MVYKVVCVMDTKAEAYNRPFFVHSTGVAIRGFSDEVNSGKADSALTHHPEDFVLYELGTWDENSGKITVLDVPKALVSGIDVRRPDSGLKVAN